MEKSLAICPWHTGRNRTDNGSKGPNRSYCAAKKLELLLSRWTAQNIGGISVSGLDYRQTNLSGCFSMSPSFCEPS
jgi:hypothetical protein